METSSLRQVAEESAAAGAAVARESFREQLQVQQKGDKNDVVTEADREAQAAVVERIQQATPDATIYGEEGDDNQHLSTDGITWIIDPIDGTNNYVRGNRRWATSVACLVDGEAVAAVNILPAMGDRYVASPESVVRNGTALTVSDRTDPERFAVVPTFWWGLDRRTEYAAATEAIVRQFGDLRRIGSAQVTLSLVAAGALDGAITNRETNAWDIVAGARMVEWAGGTVTDLDGQRWHHDDRGLVVSNGQAHEELLTAARTIDGAVEQS